MDFTWVLVIVLIIAGAYLLLRYRLASRETISLRHVARQLREQGERLARQIADEQQIHQALIETMVDPVFYVDSDRSIIYSNLAAQQLTRGAAQPGHSLMEAARSYELDHFVDETLTAQNELPQEITVNERLFRMRATVISTGSGKRSAIVTLRDISELQRLGRARRDFVANISHELRTPLTAIRLLADTLRISDDLDADQRARYLDQISLQVDALTQLAQEMYDLSQIESGQVPMRMVRASLHDLTERVIERITPQAERAGTTLADEIGETVYALVDPIQISRVLTNLLHNAIKFTTNGSIRVFTVPNSTPEPGVGSTAASADDYLTVAVKDTGVGISKNDLPRIFERFYKVNRARGQGGTGLGLAIAKHIVEAHGGRIWVESVEGRGATFYFTVPRES
jgi:two-component system phosphate regulon sensor histidine kinase PhoR